MATPQETATFAAKLDTSGMVSGAASGTDALEKMRKSIAGETAELSEMQKALRNLKGSSAVSATSIKALTDRISAQKASIAQTQAKYLDLGGSFKKVQPNANALGGALGALLERAKAAGGPLGGLAEKLSGLSKYAVAGAVATLAAAVVILTVAVYGAVAALTAYAVAQANAHRNELLTLDAMTKARNYWGIAAGSATEMQGALNKVAASSALTRGELLGLEQGLYRSNLRGQNLTDALEGLAIVQQTQGSTAAAAFQAQVAGANMAGVAVRRLTDDVRARLGGIAARQMLDLNVLTAKLHENFAVLFQDLKVEPLLKAMQSVTELFSQTTESGKALKVLAETLLQPLIDSAVGDGPILRRFFQGIILGALDMAIAIQKTRLWFRKTFGDSSLIGNINATSLALTLGKVAVLGLIVVLGTLAVTTAVVFGLIALAVLAVVGPIVLLVKAFQTAYRFMKGLDWKKVGTDLLEGLALGIQLGVFMPINAIKKLGKTLIAELRRAFDSHSPSRIAASIGFSIPEGLGVGQRKGTPTAVAATKSMGDSVLQPLRAIGGGAEPRRNATQAATRGESGGRAPIQVTIDKLICQGGTTQEQATSVKDTLIEELTKIGISLGANLEVSTV